MDIKQLRYFSEIVKQRSFGKASRQLHIAQPALSLHIKNLEIELGIQLLKRHARGVDPTAEGTILFNRASQILAGMEAIKSDMTSRALVERPRTIHIGINPSSEVSLIALFIAIAKEKLPHISLSFVEGPGALIVQLVRSGELDFCLTYEVPPHPDLQSEVLSRQDAVFVQSEVNIKPGEPDEITFQEVCRHPLTLPRDPHACRLLVEQAAEDHGFELSVPFELVVGKAMMVDFISKNLINAILPRSAAEAIARSTPTSVRSIVQPRIRFAEHLVYSNTHPSDIQSKAVMSLIREIASAELDRACMILEGV